MGVEFTVSVVLRGDDVFMYSPDQAAQQVIAALGGNPTTDFCTVSVQQASTGQAGVPPPPVEQPPS